MKVEEKNESDLKQDQSNNPQSKKDTDVVIEKDKIQDEKNKEAEGLESKNKEELNGKKVKEIEEKILRTLAEMENQRRRFEKEKKEAFEFGGFNFAAESLLLLDNIECAIVSFKNDESLKNNKGLKKIIDGIEIVKKDLVASFKKNGSEAIECINKKFDPNFHQAILEVEDFTKEAGTVIQEIQKGYMMKDRLLRPSLVGVTKKREQKDKETKTNETKSEKNDEKK